MFIAFCIGSFSLVIVLEFLRRLQRDYDRQLSHRPCIRDKRTKFSETDTSSESNYDDPPNSAVPLLHTWMQPASNRDGYVPNVIQQAIRASIYTLQFVVAYTLMLLAMYYNGYILISIFVGAFVGYFTFSWMAIDSAIE